MKREVRRNQFERKADAPYRGGGKAKPRYKIKTTDPLSERVVTNYELWKLGAWEKESEP